ncbi:MAG: hypothetical protein PHS96_10915 [Anaerolineales bacterium]|nr:hypothetical protein [Anaerolineales bacterium]
MPTLTRWFVKTSLFFFSLALFLGMLLAAHSAWPLPAFLGAFGPIYFHTFLVGWVTQLIFGVVYWMFPKYTLERPRRSPALGWAVYLLINLGLLLRLVAEPYHTLDPAAGMGWLLALSAALQWLAGLFFVINTWGRVKEK